MDDKTTTITPPPPEADAHAGEPEKGPGPTAAELDERADGKAAEGIASAAVVDQAAALAAARRRLGDVAEAIAMGSPPVAPLTDDEIKLLDAAGFDHKAELESAADWHARHMAGDAPTPAAEVVVPSTPATPPEFDDATIERLHTQMMADRERARAGMTLHARVQAAVDGPASRLGVSALSLAGLGQAELDDLTRYAGAMGWSVRVEASDELAILKR
jgi:hypothetical protein